MEIRLDFLGTAFAVVYLFICGYLIFTPALSAISQRLLTVKQTAKYIGRTENAVREMAWNQKLPHIRTDRRVMFDIRDLDRWIDTNRVDSNPTTK